jgi:hypothetical protein
LIFSALENPYFYHMGPLLRFFPCLNSDEIQHPQERPIYLNDGSRAIFLLIITTAFAFLIHIGFLKRGYRPATLPQKKYSPGWQKKKEEAVMPGRQRRRPD